MLKWLFINRNRMFASNYKPVINEILRFVKTGILFTRNQPEEMDSQVIY